MTDDFTPPAPLQTAVLFLVFNRPETTAQVFEAIRQAKPPRLYVAADGPRINREGEVDKVARVREIATAVDWPCEVKTLFQKENIGCHYGPRTGIDWFFENETKGIILEDDCLPSQSFFWFCEEMLNRYDLDSDVMVVTGTNITNGFKFEGDYWFSKYALMWGWASWRRAWDKYDPNLQDWPNKKKVGFLKDLKMGGWLFELTWRRIFDQTIEQGPNVTWWGYQWIYTCWINKGLTIAPTLNLIRNLGFSDDATHTSGYDPIRSNLKPMEINFPLKHPLRKKVNGKCDNYISRYWFHISWISYIKRILLYIPGVKILNAFRKKIW